MEVARKQKLLQIKQSRKPLDVTKLQEHALKHDQFKMQMQYKRQTESNHHQVLSTSFTPKYRSKFYQRNLEQE